MPPDEIAERTNMAFLMFVLGLLFTLNQLGYGCRLACKHKTVVWTKCRGNLPNCSIYNHPGSSRVKRLEFDVLNAPVDIRNLKNVERIFVRFPSSTLGCDYIISDHNVLINTDLCVSSSILNGTIKKSLACD